MNNTTEAINRPGIKRLLKVQGKNRFIARTFENHAYRTKSGIEIPNIESCQDVPTTGEVLAVSANFDEELYPDIKPGVCVKVILNSWHCFGTPDGELAIGDAEHVIAAYEKFEPESCQE